MSLSGHRIAGRATARAPCAARQRLGQQCQSPERRHALRRHRHSPLGLYRLSRREGTGLTLRNADRWWSLNAAFATVNRIPLIGSRTRATPPAPPPPRASASPSEPPYVHAFRSRHHTHQLDLGQGPWMYTHHAMVANAGRTVARSNAVNRIPPSDPLKQLHDAPAPPSPRYVEERLATPNHRRASGSASASEVSPTGRGGHGRPCPGSCLLSPGSSAIGSAATRRTLRDRTHLVAVSPHPPYYPGPDPQDRNFSPPWPKASLAYTSVLYHLCCHLFPPRRHTLCHSLAPR